MRPAKKGDTVKVHYKGKLNSGEQFDSSEGRSPLEFTVGAGQMIAGFDAAIPGMSVGEKKTVTIDGLWALESNVPNASKKQLFFTAGPADESHGLFGYLERGH